MESLSNSRSYVNALHDIFHLIFRITNEVGSTVLVKKLNMFLKKIERNKDEMNQAEKKKNHIATRPQNTKNKG